MFQILFTIWARETEATFGIGVMSSKAVLYGFVSVLIYFAFWFVEVFLQDLCCTI